MTVADTGGFQVITGNPVIGKGGSLASTGGPLANTGDSLAATRQQAKWEGRWPSQEALQSAQEAFRVSGGPLADTRVKFSLECCSERTLRLYCVMLKLLITGDETCPIVRRSLGICA